ncbi:MAG: protoporphyrinogen/coproporphyrinogen oxidase [Isosphaerales bacterium]
MNVGILGGGISGITLQRYLRHPSEVLEASGHPGGLCSTIFKDGFGYDIGGHILFSKSQQINQLVEELLGDNCGYAKRANKIYFKNRFVKYPFENGLGVLDKEDIYECLIGYLKRGEYPRPTNLREWCYHRFGKGLAEMYLIPYNEKIWNIATDQMSLEWVDRIPSPPLEDIVKSALGHETEGYLHQLYFKYPKKGGVQALVDATLKPDGVVTCGFRVESIRRQGSGWAVAGSSGGRSYDQIVVTFPIHEAIACFEGVPDEVEKAVASLRYNTINVVFIALNDESLLQHSALYIPDPNVVTHRLCYMGFFSKELVKPGTSSLIAEITTNPGDGIHEMSDAALTERVIEDLNREGLLDKRRIIVTDVTRCKYGYPVYDLDYYKNTKILHDYFASINVDLCGRFAQFDYINSDECMRRAIALADRFNLTAN